MKQIEKILKALANKRRLAILQCLKNNREEPVGEIARNINLSFKATSKHLAILFSADIVDKEQRSLQIYYSLSRTMHSLVKQVIHLL